MENADIVFVVTSEKQLFFFFFFYLYSTKLNTAEVRKTMTRLQVRLRGKQKLTNFIVSTTINNL